VKSRNHNADLVRLAVIGMGQRVTHMARMMCEADADVRVVAAVDPETTAASARAVAANLPDADLIHFYSSVEQLVADADRFDGILIGTQCHLHAPLAVAVAATGLPLFLEKPVAISWEQWNELADAYRGRGQNVVVSFPLRVTAHVRTAVEIIRSGRLGIVNQVQAVNNVSYGGVYFGQWYRDYDKTGGLWLQKATHDLDYINCLLDATSPLGSPGVRPVSVAAMHSRTVYGGAFPADHRCSKCDVTETCMESPANLTLRGTDSGMLNYEKPTPQSDHACAFSKSIMNQDAGSAIVMYSNGAHATYSQNFLPRLSAGQRGATVIGYDATMRFDWQSDTVTIIDHHRERVDRVQVQSAGAHGGGDAVLARNFIDVVRGRDLSHSSLEQGLLSAAMCLAARDAANQGITQSVPVILPPPIAPATLAPRGPIEPSAPVEVSIAAGGSFK
jgi:predicted dehydrogenase